MLTCGFLFAPFVWFSITLNTNTLDLQMVGPRQAWRAFASSYSTPAGTRYYACFGKDRCMVVVNEYSGPSIKQAVILDDGVERECK